MSLRATTSAFPWCGSFLKRALYKDALRQSLINLQKGHEVEVATGEDPSPTSERCTMQGNVVESTCEDGYQERRAFDRIYSVVSVRDWIIITAPQHRGVLEAASAIKTNQDTLVVTSNLTIFCIPPGCMYSHGEPSSPKQANSSRYIHVPPTFGWRHGYFRGDPLCTRASPVGGVCGLSVPCCDVWVLTRVHIYLRVECKMSVKLWRVSRSELYDE